MSVNGRNEYHHTPADPAWLQDARYFAHLADNPDHTPDSNNNIVMAPRTACTCAFHFKQAGIIVRGLCTAKLG